MTALYGYKHNFATMFVCESAFQTGLCQVLHTERALAIAGMNWKCMGDVNQTNHMLNLDFMMSEQEIQKFGYLSKFAYIFVSCHFFMS